MNLFTVPDAGPILEVLVQVRVIRVQFFVANSGGFAVRPAQVRLPRRL